MEVYINLHFLKIQLKFELHLANETIYFWKCTPSIVLYVGEIIFLKSSILTGDEGSKKIAVAQQSSTEVPDQESGTPAVSGAGEELHEEAPSPSNKGTCQQSPSYQSAEEEPETLDGEECLDSGQSQITIDLTALTSEERLSEPPPTVTGVSDLCHLQQTLENSDPAGGREGESDESTEGAETVETEFILTEENTNDAISTEEPEDVQSNQETELSDETDVCQEIQA